MKILEKIPNFHKVLEHFGSIHGLANALGISPYAIYQWEKMPVGRAYQIEHLSKRKIKAASLLTKKA